MSESMNYGDVEVDEDEQVSFTKARINPLKERYLKVKEELITEVSLMRKSGNINELFGDYIEWKLKNRQLINIQIRGQVRTGKSTVGLTLMMWINSELVRVMLREELPNTYECIMGDQTEFLRFAKKGTKNVCILVDEYNKMAESGANATTEKNLLDDYSSRFAAWYVHRIGCSPVGTIDHLAEVFLDF